MNYSEFKELNKEIEVWMDSKLSPLQFFGFSKPEPDEAKICKEPLFGTLMLIKIHQYPDKYKAFKDTWYEYFSKDTHPDSLKTISGMVYEAHKHGIGVRVYPNNSFASSSNTFDFDIIDKSWVVGGLNYSTTDGALFRTYLFNKDEFGNMKVQYLYGSKTLKSGKANKDVTFYKKNIPVNTTLDVALPALFKEHELSWDVHKLLMDSEIKFDLLDMFEHKQEAFNKFMERLDTSRQTDIYRKFSGVDDFNIDSFNLVYGEANVPYQVLSELVTTKKAIGFESVVLPELSLNIEP